MLDFRVIVKGWQQVEYDKIINLTDCTVVGLDKSGNPMGEGFPPRRGEVLVGNLPQGESDERLLFCEEANIWTQSGQSARIVGLPDPVEHVWYIIPEEWRTAITASGRALWDLLITDERQAVRDGYTAAIKGYRYLTRVADMPQVAAE